MKKIIIKSVFLLCIIQIFVCNVEYVVQGSDIHNLNKEYNFPKINGEKLSEEKLKEAINLISQNYEKQDFELDLETLDYNENKNTIVEAYEKYLINNEEKLIYNTVDIKKGIENQHTESYIRGNTIVIKDSSSNKWEKYNIQMDLFKFLTHKPILKDNNEINFELYKSDSGYIIKSLPNLSMIEWNFTFPMIGAVTTDFENGDGKVEILITLNDKYEITEFYQRFVKGEGSKETSFYSRGKISLSKIVMEVPKGVQDEFKE